MEKKRNLPFWMTKKKSSNNEKAETNGATKRTLQIDNFFKTSSNPPYKSSTFAESSSILGNNTHDLSSHQLEHSLTSKYLSYNKKIFYFTKFSDIAQASDELLTWVNNSHSGEKIPIGFDMEWTFTYQTGPLKTGLIQLCVSLNVCYLFQVWNIPTLPMSLKLLLQHEKVLLHGVMIKNDIRKLRRDFPDVGEDVEKMINNCVDLGTYTNQVLGLNQTWSMARLVRELLKTEINKDKAVRMSKWNLPLSQDQKMYAAIDVYASQLMYLKLKAIEEKELEKEVEKLERELIQSFEKEDEKEQEELNSTKDFQLELNRIKEILSVSAANSEQQKPQ